MDAFPAFYPLTGRKVVVAGVGEAAEAKARLFDGSPAKLVRLTDHHAFAAGSYAGAALAFVGSEDVLFRQAAAAAARAARVPLNVVDHPELSDFHTPAVIDRGEVVAAVGTAGAAPALAALLRNDIEARVPPGAGKVAALLRRRQDAVRAALPDAVARRGFLREVIAGPAAEAAMAGDDARAGELFDAALAAAEARKGRVTFVAGKGPADLLTLRAARVLAEADVIVADPGVDPGVLNLARRDAYRSAETEAEALAAWAHGGRHVVRLITDAVPRETLAALAEAGVAVDAVPAAAGT